MVAVANQVNVLAPDVRVRLSGLLNGAILSSIAILLGYLGWALPSPGGSLVVPTLIVFGIGCAAAVIYWIATGSKMVTIVAAAITVVASVWTFAFSLPTSVAWGSNATAQAQVALRQLALTPRDAAGVTQPQCSTKRTGSVGPLDAPYRQCAFSTPQGTMVTFTVTGGPPRGLGYTNQGAATFPDECSRHLIADWWMFTGETSGTGDCPFGYRFHGGG